MNIVISLRTQKLINKYGVVCGLRPSNDVPIDSSIDLETLIEWLCYDQTDLMDKPKKIQQQCEFILASLRAELFQDLLASMKGDAVTLDKKEKESSRSSKVGRALIMAAGILVSACQGFDGIATMLTVFNLSSFIILGAGFAFALLSIFVFCGFDLVKVSDSLGVPLNNAYKLLDIYVAQLQKIKSIRKKMANYNLAELLPKDLKKLEQILVVLQQRFVSLVASSKQFDEALNNEKMYFTKTLISSVAALLFLGGGFFAGQSVALFISGLVISSVTPGFWPVLIFSTLVGMAALSIYWYMERPGLNKIVSCWFGINEESVHKLCDQNLLTKETKKLESLKEKLISSERQASKVRQLEKRKSSEEKVSSDESTHHKSLIKNKVSVSAYSFLKYPNGSVYQKQVGETIQVACCAK